MSFLALDIGGTYLKGAVLDTDPACIRKVTRRPFCEFSTGLSPERRELDPGKIMDAVRSLLGELAAGEKHLQGLLLCNQKHGFLWVDEKGNALSPYISWQDKRVDQFVPGQTVSYFEAIRRKFGDRILGDLGNELKPGFPSTVLYWSRQQGHVPGNSVATGLGDFIAASLCQTLPLTDPSNASAHGMLDLDKQSWHEEVLSILGLNAKNLPRICPSGTVAGTFTLAGQKIPCLVSMGDSQCALLGVGLEESEMSINIATGSQVSRRTEKAERGPFQTVPFPGRGFLKTITHLPAGRSLNALLSLLTELGSKDPETLWDRIIAETSGKASTDLKCDLSFFPCSVGREGSISGITEETLTVGNLFYAAFASMAENYAWAADHLGRASEPPHRVVFSGGLARKIPLLREQILSALPFPSRMTSCAEETFLGLLTLASAFEKKVDLEQSMLEFKISPPKETVLS